MYSGGHMGMAECIFKVQGISRPFLIFFYDYSSLDLMVFQDLLWPLPPWWDAISETFMTKGLITRAALARLAGLLRCGLARGCHVIVKLIFVALNKHVEIRANSNQPGSCNQVLSQSATPTTPPPPPTHPNTQTQSQKPQWHKQSMLYFLQLEI